MFDKISVTWFLHKFISALVPLGQRWELVHVWLIYAS